MPDGDHHVPAGAAGERQPVLSGVHEEPDESGGLRQSGGREVGDHGASGERRD